MKFLVPPTLIRLAQFAALAALAVLLWKAADGRVALTHLQQANPRWLVAAGLALTLQTVLSAQRWRMTAAQLGLKIPAGAALREYYLAQVVNQSLPGGVVGDASRAVRLRAEAGLLVSAQAVLFERVAGQLGLIAVLVTGLAMGAVTPDKFAWPLWLATSFMGLIAAGFVMVTLVGLSPSLRRFAGAFSHAVWARNVRAQQTALSLGTALCNVAAFAFCALALDVAIPLIAVATLIPMILFAMILPISIGGWGVREGAAALLFPVIGATSAQGLGTSVAFGLVFLATILPGVILPLMRPNRSVRADSTEYINLNYPTNSAEKELL